MIFLLNFTQFDAIIANFETHFAYFETKIPDRFGRGWGMSSFPCSKRVFFTLVKPSFF